MPGRRGPLRLQRGKEEGLARGLAHLLVRHSLGLQPRVDRGRCFAHACVRSAHQWEHEAVRTGPRTTRWVLRVAVESAERAGKVCHARASQEDSMDSLVRR